MQVIMQFFVLKIYQTTVAIFEIFAVFADACFAPFLIMHRLKTVFPDI